MSFFVILVGETSLLPSSALPGKQTECCKPALLSNFSFVLYSQPFWSLSWTLCRSALGLGTWAWPQLQKNWRASFSILAGFFLSFGKQVSTLQAWSWEESHLLLISFFTARWLPLILSSHQFHLSCFLICSFLVYFLSADYLSSSLLYCFKK